MDGNITEGRDRTSTRDQDLLREAISLGRHGMRAGKGGPFGAIIVLDGSIIGRGCNQVTIENDPTAHAEVNAIRDACRHSGTYHLHNATLYTSCEPCPMCLGAAYWARIERIVFASTRDDAAHLAGFDDANFYLEVVAPWQDRSLRHSMLLREEGNDLLREWSRMENKELY